MREDLHGDQFVTFPSERCVYVLPSLLYDRDDATDDAAAMRCHDELFKALMEAGYYPHRLGIQSMGMLPPAGDDSAAIWQRLKQILDPAGILAPGRYEPANINRAKFSSSVNQP